MPEVYCVEGMDIDDALPLAGAIVDRRATMPSVLAHTTVVQYRASLNPEPCMQVPPGASLGHEGAGAKRRRSDESCDTLYAQLAEARSEAAAARKEVRRLAFVLKDVQSNDTVFSYLVCKSARNGSNAEDMYNSMLETVGTENWYGHLIHDPHWFCSVLDDAERNALVQEMQDMWRGKFAEQCKAVSMPMGVALERAGEFREADQCNDVRSELCEEFMSCFNEAVYTRVTDRLANTA